MNSMTELISIKNEIKKKLFHKIIFKHCYFAQHFFRKKRVLLNKNDMFFWSYFSDQKEIHMHYKHIIKPIMIGSI